MCIASQSGFDATTAFTCEARRDAKREAESCPKTKFQVHTPAKFLHFNDCYRNSTIQQERLTLDINRHLCACVEKNIMSHGATEVTLQDEGPNRAHVRLWTPHTQEGRNVSFPEDVHASTHTRGSSPSYLWLCGESERNTVCECLHVSPQGTPCPMITVMMMKTVMAERSRLDKGNIPPGVSKRLPGSAELCSLIQLLLFIYRQQWLWIARITTTGSHLSLLPINSDPRSILSFCSIVCVLQVIHNLLSLLTEPQRKANNAYYVKFPDSTMTS